MAGNPDNGWQEMFDELDENEIDPDTAVAITVKIDQEELANILETIRLTPF